jgi:hypothetical protein
MPSCQPAFPVSKEKPQMTETGNDAPEDYELDLQEGVDDEADNDTEDIVGFNITSYGAD